MVGEQIVTASVGNTLAELTASELVTDCDALDNGIGDDSCIDVAWSNATVASSAEPA